MDCSNVSGGIVVVNRFDLVYQNSINELLVSMERDFEENNLSELDGTCEIESNLDAWDYCFSVTVGLAGVFFSTNERIDVYLQDIHKSASGVSGKYDNFQQLIGRILHHAGDTIDQVNGKFINRKGDNAWGLFHRLLWGHDVLSIKEDNPFWLMINQNGIVGIIQVVRHLLADTMSHQGLPLPGSSFLDHKVKRGEKTKISNYLIDIAKKLSEGNDGGNIEAERIYSHMFTLRAQDIAGTSFVQLLSASYVNAREIKDEIRISQIKLVSYAICFWGEALYGSIKQNGIPYINTSLGILLGKEYTNLLINSFTDTLALCKETNDLSINTDELIKETQRNQLLLNDDKQSVDDYLYELIQGKENLDSLIEFLSEE